MAERTWGDPDENMALLAWVRTDLSTEKDRWEQRWEQRWELLVIVQDTWNALVYVPSFRYPIHGSNIGIIFHKDRFLMAVERTGCAVATISFPSDGQLPVSEEDRARKGRLGWSSCTIPRTHPTANGPTHRCPPTWASAA